MANEFRIGKFGPTILHGTAVPDDGEGNSGDLYVLMGASPSLFQKRGSSWVGTADPSFGFYRQAVTSPAATLLSNSTYVGMNVASAATLTLPQGVTGRQVIIKDESGLAASNPITVAGDSGVTIDGQPSWLMNLNYGSLHLIYGATQWHIVAGVVSAPYSEVRL